jgi:hypothetical protein
MTHDSLAHTHGRFVLLEHDHPVLHWDLMIEAGGVLRTWRLPRLPSDVDEMTAEAIADHRLAYLDYEGEVSGGRGCVIRRDRGTYTAAMIFEDAIELRLSGEQWQGTIAMRRIDSTTWRVSIRAANDDAGSQSKD